MSNQSKLSLFLNCIVLLNVGVSYCLLPDSLLTILVYLGLLMVSGLLMFSVSDLIFRDWYIEERLLSWGERSCSICFDLIL
jgi:hypothetical protein